MEREDASAEAGGPELHPPLPSIDMPLLRPGRRRPWKKRVIWGAGGAALVASAVGGSVWLFQPGPDEAHSGVGTDPATEGPTRAEHDPLKQDPTANASPASEDGDRPGANASGSTAQESSNGRRVTVRFGDSRGFRHALISAGVARPEYLALEAALEDIMDFRRCRPEDEMVFERTNSGVLNRFEYHGSDATEYYLATASGSDAFEGERVERPVTVETIRRGAVVRTSLVEAIVRAGLDRALASELTSAFDSKADFSTDTRSGDTVRLIVDKEFLDGEFLRFSHLRAVRYDGQKTGTIEAFWFAERSSDTGEYWDGSGHAMQGGWLRTPCRFDRISSPFNPRRMHPILRRIQPHNGVDYAAGTGTPVWAAADGRISFAGEKGANGNLVSIRHDGGFESHYAHLSRFARGIRSGMEVSQRQLIGYVGSTGRSTGPHLHFGLKLNGQFVDPMDHLNGPGRGVLPHATGRFRRLVRRLRGELDAITPVRAP